MATNGTHKQRAPLWRRALKWVGIAVLVLALLVVALVQFENWRGRRAWQSFVAESRAAGEDLRLEAVIPPPVPDEQNFAAIPLLRPLFDYTNARIGGIAGEAVWKDPQAKERWDKFSITGTNSKLSTIGWRSGKFVDLASWQSHYRAQTNFPATCQQQTPGRDVLYALAKFDPELAQLRLAAQRPKSRYPIHYEESTLALLPHLSSMKFLVRLPQLRALAELSEGQMDLAHGDLMLGLQAAESLSEEPILMSQLVRMALFEIAVQPLWEGLARHQWPEKHLGEIDLRLSQVNYFVAFRMAMRGERNLYALEGIELMYRNPGLFVPVKMEDELALENWWLKTPRAFVDQSKVNMGKLYNQLLKIVDPVNRRFYPTQVSAIETDAERALKRGWSSLYHILASLQAPSMAKGAEKFARAQTTVDLARVAIALERHRLKHGVYPPTLEALDAAFVPAGGVPHDVISGGPLHYSPTADGRFQLYAVGWNQTDDGGSVVWKDKAETQVDFSKGDWVWPQPRE
jgi:hypothetical protein